MDFSLSDDQKLIRDTVRQFMEAELRPKTRQYDREEKFPAEEIARVDAATAVTLSVTNSVAGMPLWTHGSEPQKKRYLRQLATGEMLGAFCLTEPQAGSDAAGIQARATRDGNIYKLNGTKTWVSNGGVAGLYLVFAKTDPNSGARGVTAFLVEPE